MKKLYAIITLMVMASANLFAQTMTEENQTLADMGYVLQKDVDFRGGMVNGKEILPAEQLTFSGIDEDLTLNKYHTQRVTNSGLEFLSIARTGKNDIYLQQGNGLRTIANERWFAVNELRKGQILVFDISSTDTTQFVVNSIACNSGTGWADTPSDPLIVAPISDGIHKLQAESGADTYRYFEVINPGTLSVKFNGKSSQYIYRMQIWGSADEDEAVSAPSFTMTRVDGAMRLGTVKSGESSKGSAVSTWYSFESVDPIFLKDTEEIAKADTIWLDEEHTQFELENIVYKKVLDPKDGFYGENEYYEGDEIGFDNNDDEDADGYVNLNIATVSETGGFSEIQTYRIAVGEIDLNPPTLTLVGIDGLLRTYQIGWTNNTLCKEPFVFSVSTDDGANEITDLELGATVSAYNNITVKVEVPGYNPGEYTLDELFQENVEISRKNGTEKAHDWDFQNLTEEQLSQINQMVIDHYAVYDEEDNVIATYTVEQYDNGDIPDGADIVAIAKNFGWDGSDSRNAARHWRTWIPTYAVDQEGNPTETIESSVYAEETTGMFDGLVVDNQHPNYSTMAIFTDQSGLYFMSKGTIEVKDVKYGEIVMYTTNGGTQVIVNEDPYEPLVINVAAGTYVYNIDVLTYENLPDEIKNVLGDKVMDSTVYSIDGRVVNRNADINSLQKGMYILNGKKFIVK